MLFHLRQCGALYVFSPVCHVKLWFGLYMISFHGGVSLGILLTGVMRSPCLPGPYLLPCMVEVSGIRLCT